MATDGPESTVVPPKHGPHCTSFKGECRSMHCPTCGDIWHGGGPCPKDSSVPPRVAAEWDNPEDAAYDDVETPAVAWCPVCGPAVAFVNGHPVHGPLCRMRGWMSDFPSAGSAVPDALLEIAEASLGDAVTILERFQDDFFGGERYKLGVIKQTWDVVHNAVEAARSSQGYAQGGFVSGPGSFLIGEKGRERIKPFPKSDDKAERDT